MPTLGFILLTHDRPVQMLRVVNRVNALYDNPPIACHHDFGKTPIDVSPFPPNLSFVRPGVRTAWGSFGVSQAMFLALEHLYARPDAPDWFAMISAADYPIKPAAHVLAELTPDVDAFVEHEWVDYTANRGGSPEFAPRYLRKMLPTPFVPTHRALRFRKRWALPAGLSKPFVPFNDSFRCYKGSQWITGNRRAAGVMLRHWKDHPRFVNHYRNTFASEESLFHSILANDKSLKLVNDDRRYVDGHFRGERLPNVLRLDDLPQLLASKDHFARKMDLERYPELYDALDRHVDAMQAVAILN